MTTVRSQMRRLSAAILMQETDKAPTAPKHRLVVVVPPALENVWHFQRILFKHTFAGLKVIFSTRSALFGMEINFPAPVKQSHPRLVGQETFSGLSHSVLVSHQVG